MSKDFASRGDLQKKQIVVSQLSPRAFAYTAEGDPNSGLIIGERAAMVVDAQATPRLAAEVIRRARQLTDKPIKYLVLSHYHAVRVMGASAYADAEIIASKGTRFLIDERGQADFDSEVERFPRLFEGVEEVPGLTHPTMVFDGDLTIDLGGCEVRIFHPGAGHTSGDTVVWLAEDKVLFAGDLVEHGATPYCGDAHFAAWPATIAKLRALNPVAATPGRGAALMGAAAVADGFAQTERFVSQLFNLVADRVRQGQTLSDIYPPTFAAMQQEFSDWVIFEHCMPFNVSRAFDEASGIAWPRVWTAARDRDLWAQLA